MPRSRRGGGGGGLFGSRSRAPAKPVQRAPARSASTTTSAPMKSQSQGGGMLSGIGSTIAQGMAFGTGSAIAHRAVGAVAGSLGGGGGGDEQHAPLVENQAQYGQEQQPMQSTASQGPCGQDKQLVFECLQSSKGDQQVCQFFMESLQTCMRDQNQMQFS